MKYNATVSVSCGVSLLFASWEDFRNWQRTGGFHPEGMRSETSFH